jgi:hypothetical protein
MKTHLKKLIILLMVMLPLIGFSQTGPAAPGNGIYAIIDTTYQVGTSIEGETKARITLQNTTSTLTTGLQFRVFYDNTAFDTATVALVNPATPNVYFQSLVNQAEGHITMTLVYTGSSSSYTLGNGETFEITFTHIAASSFQALSAIDSLKWTGVQTFPHLAAEQSGVDTTLTLHNYGGEFIRPSLQFTANFTNVSGTGAKNLTFALERKPKTSGSWATFDTYLTDVNGNVVIDEIIDTTYWDVRLAVQGDTMGVGNIISVADAHQINQWVTTESNPQGFEYYLGDVNGDNDITISDAYGVFGRIAGRFSEWPNNIEDVKFFTSTEYNTITGTPATNYMSTIPGVTNFTYEILPGVDSVTFYVLVPGDANNTGFNMARVTPIPIVNPTNAPGYLIDETVEYDMPLPTVEVNVPNLSVNEGNLVVLPVKVITGNEKISSLQLGLIYDENLLEFKEVNNSQTAMTWMSFVNPTDGIIEWGGYDVTNKENLLSNNDVAFTISFRAKKPQDEWVVSPLYTTRKFVGDANSKDMNITPTNGVVEVKMIQGGGVLSEFNELVIYPNPSKDNVFINFNVNYKGNVNLAIKSIDGRTVANVINQSMPVGNYTYSANLSSLAEGVYLAMLIGDGDFLVGKLIIMK